MARTLLTLFGFVAAAFLAGLVGSRFLPGPWYDALEKPAWNPPAWVFGPVWSTLYLLIGIAGWLVWRRVGFGLPLVFWSLQLAANALWSYLFFGLQRPDLALVDIVFLLALIVATLLAFRPVSPLAAALLVPYLLWVAFATALNLALWRLNS